MSTNKSFYYLGLGILVGIVLGAAGSLAQANFLQDLWSRFSSPSTEAPSAKDYQPVIDYENAVTAAVNRTSPAVVSIIISKNVPIIENCRRSPFSDLPPEFQEFFGDIPAYTVPCDTGRTRTQEVGGGSGFIVSAEGLIVTNKHVVSDANASYTVFLNDGSKYEARVLARDPIQDLAVIKIEASNLPTVVLGDSANLVLGQTAIAIGNALAEFKNTVSVGVVSGLARTVTATGGPGSNVVETLSGLIQTDAAINPGNSGGPLLNLRGEVIGINTAVASGAQNIGFAIPINKAKSAIVSVERTGTIKAPFLGVRYLSLSPEIAREKGLTVASGALLDSESGPAVIPGSPAEKAGLKEGDIILKIGGEAVDQDHPLSDLLSSYNVGDAVDIVVQRGSRTFTLNVVLAERPQKI